MAKFRQWWWGFLLVVIVAFASGADSQTRTWSDASGKFSVEATLVEVIGDKAVLKKTDGSQITVPLAKLSKADRDYLKSQANPTTSSDDPAETKSATAELTPQQLKEIANLATKFYEDLRNAERTVAAEMLTAKGKETFEAGKSILNTLPTPDEGARTIRTGRARMEGSTTEVPVRVTVGGAGVSTKLHFREEDNQWRVFAISASFPDGEKTLDFEIANTPGERVDPLKALVGTKFELSGYTVKGRPFNLDEFEGKVVLIDFWATWCGPCKAEIPNIKANWDKYHDAGFEVVAVSIDKRMDDLKNFLDAEPAPWVVLADHHPKNRNKASDRFGIKSIPAFVLVGPDGKVVAIHCRGEALGRHLEKLLGSKLAAK